MPVPRRRASSSPTAVDEEEALRSRRRRATEEALEVRLRSERPVVELEVRNPAHGTSYRVFLPEYPERASALCTCTDFARRGLGTCKHLEAAVAASSDLAALPRVAGGEPPAVPAGELWAELERLHAALLRHPPREIRELEAAGRPMWSRPSGDAKKEGVEEGVGRGRKGPERATSTSPARP